MKCPLCNKDFDSVDCEHWGPDLIKEIMRLKKALDHAEKEGRKAAEMYL